MSSWRREVLKTAFEQRDGHWVWYANAWARGVMVTPSEREIYLGFNPIAFRRAIAGRQSSEARRPYWRTFRRIISTMVLGRDPG